MGNSQAVFCVHFARDGRLATAGADGIVRVWEAEGRRLLYAFSGHPGQVLSVAWPDQHIEQRWLASGGEDGTFNIWDTLHGRLLRSVPGHTGGVSSIGWAGPYVSFYTAGEDGLVRSGAAEHGDSFPLFDASEYRGHVLAVSSNYSFAFGGAGDTVYTWDAEFRRVELLQWGYRARVLAMAWSPAPARPLFATGTADGTLHLFQWGRGSQVTLFAEHGAAVSSVAWSQDGRQLASAGADGTVRVWDVDSAREQRALSGHTGRALSVAWGPSGQRLVSAGEDGVCVWDPGTGALLGRLSSDATPEAPSARGRVEELRSPSAPKKPSAHVEPRPQAEEPPAPKQEERPSFAPIPFEPVPFVPISAVPAPLPPLSPAHRPDVPESPGTYRGGVDGTWETDIIGATNLPSMRVVLRTVGSTLTGEVWYFHHAGHSPVLERISALAGTLHPDGTAEWTETEKSGLGDWGPVRGRFTGNTFQGTPLRPDGSPLPRGDFELRLVSYVTSYAHTVEFPGSRRAGR